MHKTKRFKKQLVLFLGDINMAFVRNKVAIFLSTLLAVCFITLAVISKLADKINLPFEKLQENLIRLHQDVLQENSLKYRVLTSDMYAQRVLQLHQTCSNSSHDFLGDSTDNEVMFNIHIEQKHNLVYCQIQKVGSTFIRKLLAEVFRQSKIKTSQKEFKRLKQRKSELGFAQLHSIIQNSDKFMFVREPYSRVLSGYVDKLFAPNTVYWGITGKYIVSQVRNSVKAKVKCGHDVSFPEFVKYIILSEEGHSHTDRHFTPMYEHCRPCQIPYDFVGKLETMKNDILFLLDVWNTKYGTNITFGDFESETAEHRALGKGKALFGMRKNIEKCMPFYNASVRAWKNLQIRGLLPIQESYPFSKDFTEKQMTLSDLNEAIKRALAAPYDSKSIKYQKTEAFIEAYSMVPRDDLEKLQKILDPDCKLFGYDPFPPSIFSRESSKENLQLKYFNA